ncbi:DUF3318 domain-containing protein [Pseudanabaena sp. UWO310]|uniref:DUF3318 domain-containing protein n=1 Tax=Pseudanabaena sp. UWO310 TaxID=2480795 RepID=UPI001160203C|nr:DUF3318 domain-containing protein [Pseudanabaena sp. UWO310]TYQ24877.1 DUF3318 domain-containing protein [Pseudanabaena sp. UWO310]
MNINEEIARLRDLLPASWRMTTSIKSTSEQIEPIASLPILPWQKGAQILINFRLWRQLPEPQRDLLLLYEVSWRQQTRWLQTGAYQGVAAMSLAGGIVEAIQGDITGIAIAILLGTIGINQILRKNKSSQIQIESDREALEVAQRRGYREAEAARALLDGIPAAAKLAGRNTPEFTELIRCQNLRAIAGLSKTTIPETGINDF